MVYEGAVTHRRYKPVRHDLKYKVFSFLFDLDALDGEDKKLRFFSRNKFNLFSFYDRDHDAEDIVAKVRKTLTEAGLAADGRLLALCYPRMLGYVFNPLTVYYCYDSNERLSAMLYEVRNTFGGRHSYVIPVESEGERIEQSVDKVFHVSPFIEMDVRYHFSLTPPAADVSVSIQTVDKEGSLLNAAFTGKGAEITDRKLLSLFFRYPLMTVKVIAGIHWEALKLLKKGLKLRSGATPENAVTVVAPDREGVKAA